MRHSLRPLRAGASVNSDSGVVNASENGACADRGTQDPAQVRQKQKQSSWRYLQLKNMGQA